MTKRPPMIMLDADDPLFDEKFRRAVGAEHGDEIVFHDRYSAAGIPPPDPATVCLGNCEGMGFWPSNDPAEWPPGAVPDEIGYVFISCVDCGGTGKRKVVPA